MKVALLLNLVYILPDGLHGSAGMRNIVVVLDFINNLL